MSQNRVNKLIIGKDIDRTTSLVLTGASQNIAEGEVVVVDKDFNVLAAGSTIADTDTIHIGVVSGSTFDYTDPSGTAVTDVKQIEYSAPIKGSKVLNFKGVSADNTATERVCSLDTSGLTPVANTEYIVRIVYKDINEHPGQFVQTYRYISADAVIANLIDGIVAVINGDSGRRVTASNSSNDLVLTGRVIPNNATNDEIDEYSQVDFDVFLRSITSAGVSTGGWNATTITNTETTATPGNGNPKLVRDREKFAQSYEGLMNRTKFPVIKPDMKTVMTKWYDSIIIEHEQEFVSADNEYTKQAPATTEIFLPANALQTTDILAVLNPWMASANQSAITL